LIDKILECAKKVELSNSMWKLFREQRAGVDTKDFKNRLNQCQLDKENAILESLASENNLYNQLCKEFEYYLSNK
jgi:hypothetical protein